MINPIVDHPEKEQDLHQYSLSLITNPQPRFLGKFKRSLRNLLICYSHHDGGWINRRNHSLTAIAIIDDHRRHHQLRTDWENPIIVTILNSRATRHSHDFHHESSDAWPWLTDTNGHGEHWWVYILVAMTNHFQWSWLMTWWPWPSFRPWSMQHEAWMIIVHRSSFPHSGLAERTAGCKESMHLRGQGWDSPWQVAD